MRLRERLLRLPMPRRLLVVVAVAAEGDALRRGLVDVHSGLEVHVIEGGVGPARAAASTATAVVRADERGEPFLGVLSAGIAGGFAPATSPGDIVIGRSSVAADLGAETPDGFLDISELGFGSSTVESDPDLLALLQAGLPASPVGEILTVSTVTGTADRAATLHKRHPDALAEGMEGFGVATAAAAAGLAFAELRTISNAIGPRDRAAWRIPDALAALERVGAALASLDP
jgi:futalosine hydrolase